MAFVFDACPLVHTGRDHEQSACNQRGGRRKRARSAATKSKPPARAAKPRLLAGGNPQIAKADGDSSVQAYIAAMPGWKRDVGRRLDALIVRTVPGVRKAVKWNSPSSWRRRPSAGSSVSTLLPIT